MPPICKGVNEFSLEPNIYQQRESLVPLAPSAVLLKDNDDFDAFTRKLQPNCISNLFAILLGLPQLSTLIDTVLQKFYQPIVIFIDDPLFDH